MKITTTKTFNENKALPIPVLGPSSHQECDNPINRIGAPHLYSQEVIAKYISSKHNFLINTLSVIHKYENLYHLADTLKILYIITDENGLIMHTSGLDKLFLRGQDTGIMPGGSLAYKHVGANGVGTALHARKSLSIIGDEHLLGCWKNYACAAALIRNPGHRACQGVLNIACAARDYRDYLLGLAVIMATIIEERMKAEQHPMHSSINLIVNNEIETIIQRAKGDNSQFGPSEIIINPTTKKEVKRYNVEYDVKSIMNEELQKNAAFDHFIFKSPVMKKNAEIARRVAHFNTTKLITGETGVGKEVLARFIHEVGPRASKPFIAVNCAAIPDNLLNTELFGYESGTFTGGAKEGKRGKFELANHGIIYLDEIGEMPFEAQSYLLRVIEEKSIFRLGGTKSIPLDVNIIASTNKDLESMVEKGTFRRDLYHRLKVVHFDIPPLRKRSEEIPMLAEFFLKQLSVKYAVQKILTEEAMKALEKYDWPGNIRELQNTIESAYVTSTGTIVDAHELNKEILEPSKTKPIIMKTSKIGPEKTEKLNIIAALKACHGKITKAAKLLNISRQTLYRKIPEYSISISRYRR